MNDSLAQEYVFERVKRDWHRRNNLKNPFSILLHILFQYETYTTIYIEQFRYADWVSGKCLKERIHTWQYAGKSIEHISSWGKVDSKSTISSTTPVYSFCVNEDNTLMVLEEWHGYLSASGSILRYDDKSKKWKLHKRCWVL